jgi:hypothetical protein
VAEGFVLLAGLAVGLKIRENRSRPSMLFRRAGAMLAVHYALVLFVLVFSAGERVMGWTVQASATPRNIWEVATLSYQPYLADVLSVFVFLFAAAPLFQLVYQRFGAIGLGATSAVIFFTASTFPLNTGGAFDFNSWQVVFLGGMLFGANYESLIARLKNTSNRAIMIWALLLVGAGLVRALIGPDGAPLPGWRGYLMFSRKPLTVARIVYIGLEMMVIALLTVKWWDAISKSFIVRQIAALGRYSLPVFVSSVVLDYLLKAACTELRLSFPTNLVVWLVELTLLFMLADVLDGRTAARRRPSVAASELVTN